MTQFNNDILKGQRTLILGDIYHQWTAKQFKQYKKYSNYKIPRNKVLLFVWMTVSLSVRFYSKSTSRLNCCWNWVDPNHDAGSSPCEVVSLSGPRFTLLSPVCLLMVQVAVEDRLKLLQEAHRDFGPSSQHFLSSEYGDSYLSLGKNRKFKGLFPLSYTVSQPFISFPFFCTSHFLILSLTVMHAQWICGCTR